MYQQWIQFPGSCPADVKAVHWSILPVTPVTTVSWWCRSPIKPYRRRGAPTVSPGLRGARSFLRMVGEASPPSSPPAAAVGVGRIVALYDRSPSVYQIY